MTMKLCPGFKPKEWHHPRFKIKNISSRITRNKRAWIIHVNESIPFDHEETMF